MTDIESILANERTQRHAHTNSDLLAFAVLSEISYANASARSSYRLRMFVITSIAAVMLVLQALLLSQFDFTGAMTQATQFLIEFPYAITAVNLALVTTILLVRRYRWFG
ncbi:hypothetical protein GCM10008090_18510 [Arenicella chitinivorans]|uniref:Uncharacterized protein n=1 Tax=Arenicella chitinivorans TaxID=1329800 RepID=A0A918RUE1_9GAMM|nr:hypothetical protein [Arenicella chitinivorans]GHA08909.1 hypothetical protein GCM10008090_18510 [Arenicella chitinivorans]